LATEDLDELLLAPFSGSLTSSVLSSLSTTTATATTATTAKKERKTNAIGLKWMW